MSLDEAATNPVGSGTYKLTSWTRGSEVVLERVENPNSPAKTPRIVWRIIPEASTRSAELIAGNVDIITNVAPDQIDAVNGSGNAEVQAVQGTRRMYVGFNLSDEFAAQPGGDAIQDPDVRRALQYAVDVPAICSQLLNFECVRATGIVNPPNANQSLEPYPYDPEMAEKLLDEAGWPRKDDGTRFSIKFQAGQGRYLNDRNVVLAIGQYLEDVGLDVEVELMEWASVYVPLIRQRAVGPLFFLGSEQRRGRVACGRGAEHRGHERHRADGHAAHRVHHRPFGQTREHELAGELHAARTHQRLAQVEVEVALLPAREHHLLASERDFENQVEQLLVLRVAAHCLRIPSAVSAMILRWRSLVPSPNSSAFASINSRPTSYSAVTP
jgi:hypothetical protein